MEHDDHDEGLTTAALAAAERAFTRWGRARAWWLAGCIDGASRDDDADVA